MRKPGEGFLLAVKAIETGIAGADPEGAAAVFMDRHNKILAQAARIFRIVHKTAVPPGGAIQPVEAVACGADPEDAGEVLVHGVYRKIFLAVAFRRRGNYMMKLILPPVEAVDLEAASPGAPPWIAGADPEGAGPIFQDRGYIIGAQAMGIRRIMRNAGKLTVDGVQNIETGFGADPERAGMIFMDRPDYVVA